MILFGEEYHWPASVWTLSFSLFIQFGVINLIIYHSSAIDMPLSTQYSSTAIG